MQFARTAVVVEAESGLAGLLHLAQREARTDRVDRACGEVEQIAGTRRVPFEEVLDGPVLRRRFDFGGGHVAGEPDREARIGLGIEHQPALLLAHFSRKRGAAVDQIAEHHANRSARTVRSEHTEHKKTKRNLSSLLPHGGERSITFHLLWVS